MFLDKCYLSRIEQRDEFAKAFMQAYVNAQETAHAMAYVIPNGNHEAVGTFWNADKTLFDEVAFEAYRMADAMLKARVFDYDTEDVLPS